MAHEVRTGVGISDQLIANALVDIGPIRVRSHYKFECFDEDGNLKWIEDIDNLVTTAGLTDILDKYFKGSTYTAAWFVSLVDNAGFSAFAAGDTSASHAGWAESVAYSNANRPTLTLGTVAAGSVDNSASKAQFNINATATIKGAFIITNNTKGGTTGILYGEAAFSANRSVVNGDVLNVTVTLTAS